MLRGLNLRFVGEFAYEASINPLHLDKNSVVALPEVESVISIIRFYFQFYLWFHDDDDMKW